MSSGESRISSEMGGGRADISILVAMEEQLRWYDLYIISTQLSLQDFNCAALQIYHSTEIQMTLFVDLARQKIKSSAEYSPPFCSDSFFAQKVFFQP